MYVRPISTRLLRGMLTPEMRAISTLPLLVARIRADHEDPPVPADDLALLAHRFDRGSYFHARIALVACLKPVVPAAWLWRPFRPPLPGCRSVTARAESRARAQRAMLAGACRCAVGGSFGPLRGIHGAVPPGVHAPAGCAS